MKNKNEEYVPQFADFDFNDSIDSGKCLLCGNVSNSLQNGMCVKCKNKSEIMEKITSRKKPDYDIYRKFSKKANINKAHSVSGLIVYPLFKYGYASIWFSLAVSSVIFLLLEGDSLDLGITIFSSILVIIFLCLGLLHIHVQNKKEYKKFQKFNDMNVKIFNESSWVCPCCNSINEKLSCCENCGVFPKLYNEN